MEPALCALERFGQPINVLSCLSPSVPRHCTEDQQLDLQLLPSAARCPLLPSALCSGLQTDCKSERLLRITCWVSPYDATWLKTPHTPASLCRPLPLTHRSTLEMLPRRRAGRLP